MASPERRQGECRVRAHRHELDRGAVIAFERFDGEQWITVRTLRVARGLMARLIADLSQLHAEHEEQMQLLHRDRATRDRVDQQRNQEHES